MKINNNLKVLYIPKYGFPDADMLVRIPTGMISESIKLILEVQYIIFSSTLKTETEALMSDTYSDLFFH